MQFNAALARTAAFALLFSLSACLFGGDEPEFGSAATQPPPRADSIQSAGVPTGSAVAVNRYLWAAALETLDFLPLDFADPYGGVITTEWYSNPEAPTERFRATVYILDSRLRADALRVAIFKQVFRDDLGWTDAPVAEATRGEIENAILTRARELRLDSISQDEDQ